MLESTWGVGIVSLIVAISGSVWSLAWGLNGHFSNIRKDFLSLGKEIIEKLEYQEKHHDERFASLGNDICKLKLLNAVLKGIALKNLPTNPFKKELRKHFESGG